MKDKREIIAKLKAEIKNDVEYLEKFYEQHEEKIKRMIVEDEKMYAIEEEYEMAQTVIDRKRELLITLTGRDMIDE